MIINADLHIHSRFSGATSEKMDIKTISLEAPRKGVNVVATGDCLHSGWMKEIKQCNVIDDSTFELNGTRFILSTEIEDQRRVHHLLYFPSFSAVEGFKEKIKSNGNSIAYIYSMLVIMEREVGKRKLSAKYDCFFWKNKQELIPEEKFELLDIESEPKRIDL